MSSRRALISSLWSFRSCFHSSRRSPRSFARRSSRSLGGDGKGLHRQRDGLDDRVGLVFREVRALQGLGHLEAGLGFRLHEYTPEGESGFRPYQTWFPGTGVGEIVLGVCGRLAIAGMLRIDVVGGCPFWVGVPSVRVPSVRVVAALPRMILDDGGGGVPSAF